MLALLRIFTLQMGKQQTANTLEMEIRFLDALHVNKREKVSVVHLIWFLFIYLFFLFLRR